MNQSDLARRSGLSQPTISRLLSGASIPNVLVIAQMADALAFNDKKVTVDQLLRFRKSRAK
jgi:transcriptional regulator with XRE-family HTH domain